MNALVPDPIDPLRWLSIGLGGRVRVSTDAGDAWSDISVPYAFAGAADLVIDGADTRRLFLVHAHGGVSLSEDRGQQWRRIVAPSRFIDVLPGTALWHSGATESLYAGSHQGVVRLRLDALSPP